MKNTNCPIEDFDESTYLKLNPDVFEAVQKGDFSSGWEHYVPYGFYENRPGTPKKINEKIKPLFENDATLQIPPPDLGARVHGDEDSASFKSLGKMISLNIELAIQLASIKIGHGSCILDFGCGCGRVLGWFHLLYANSRFYGTDIDNEAILWCQENLFDFVYSISVFTHLPEDMQFAWLEELQRVTKRGSYLVLTIHGEELLQTTSEEKEIFKENGFYYLVGDGTQGLPEFYQTSFHTENYIRKQWGKFFEITKIIERGIANHQDLVLCKRVK